MKLFVAIVHGQWVGLCEKYKDKLRGQFLAGIVKGAIINVFDNFFDLIKNELNTDTIGNNITKETYEEFANRIKETTLNFPHFEYLEKRMTMTIKMKETLRYQLLFACHK